MATNHVDPLEQPDCFTFAVSIRLIGGAQRGLQQLLLDLIEDELLLVEPG